MTGVQKALVRVALLDLISLPFSSGTVLLARSKDILQ